MSDVPVEKFRQYLNAEKINYQRLSSQKFIIQCKKHNIVQIQSLTQQLYRIISNKQNPKIKLNGLYLIKYLVQLGEYEIITLIEVYLLKLVEEIALFTVQNKKDPSEYFQPIINFNKNNDFQQISQNYVQLAKDLIFICAFIKPYRTFQSIQMNQLSGFNKSAKKLISLNMKQSFKNEEQHTKLKLSRQRFLTKLSKFDNESQNYIAYYMNKVQEYLINGSKYQSGSLDFKKILKFGDVFLTSEAIGHCCEALENSNFVLKTNALLLINQFFIWGDIEALMMVNYAEYIENIYKKISFVQGNISLTAGKDIYPEIAGQKENKKRFYVEFLKCLQIWATCTPAANFEVVYEGNSQNEQTSVVYKLYQKLKQQRKFKFPQNLILKNYKSQFQFNLKANQQRNNLIIKQLEQHVDDENLTSSKKSYSINTKFSKYKHKNSQIKDQKQQNFVTIQQLHNNINQSQNLLNKLLQKIKQNQIKQAESILKKLINLNQKFQTDIQYIDENVSQNQLEKVCSVGFKNIDKVNDINDHFIDYKAQKINLMQLEEYIILSMKKVRNYSNFGYQIKGKRDRKSLYSNSVSSNSQFLLKNINSGHESLNTNSLSQHKYNQLKKIDTSSKDNRFSLKSNDISYKKSQISLISTIKQNQIDKKSNISDQFKKEDEDMKRKSQNQISYDFQMNNYNFRDVKKEQNKNSPVGSSKKIILIKNSQIVSANSFKQLSKINSKISSSQSKKQIQQHLQQKQSIYTKKSVENIFLKKDLQNLSKESSIVQQNKSTSKSQYNFLDAKNVISFGNLQKNKNVRKFEGSLSQNSMEGKFQQGLKDSVRQMQSLKNQIQKNNVESYVQSSKELFENPSLSKSIISEYQSISKVISEKENPSFGILFKNKQHLRNSRLLNSSSKQKRSSKIIGLSRKKSNISSSKNQIHKSSSKNQIFQINLNNKQKDSDYQDKNIYTASNNFKYSVRNSRLEDFNVRQSFHESPRRSLSQKNKLFRKNSQSRQHNQLKLPIKQLRQVQNIYTNSSGGFNNPIQKPRFILSPRSPRFRPQNSSPVFYNKNSLGNITNQRSSSAKLSHLMNSSISHIKSLIKPQGQLVQKRIYNKYLQQLQSHRISLKQKKHLFQSKSLVMKNQFLQIGVISQRQRNEKVVKLIYFVTSQVGLKFVAWRVVQNEKVKCEIEKDMIEDIQMNKHQINEVPYHLPILQFSYQLSEQKSRDFFCAGPCSSVPTMNQFQCFLPIPFIKFINIEQIQSEKLNQHFLSRQIHRTEQFLMNPKIIKRSNQIMNYIPNLNKVIENDFVNVYAGKGCYQRCQFIIRFTFKINNFMFIQGVNLEKGQRHQYCQKNLQFLMLNLQKFLMKDQIVRQD